MLYRPEAPAGRHTCLIPRWLHRPATLGRVQSGVAVGHRRQATRSALDGFRSTPMASRHGPQSASDRASSSTDRHAAKRILDLRIVRGTRGIGRVDLVELLRPQVTPVDPEPLNQTRPIRVVIERLNELALPHESVILAIAQVCRQAPPERPTRSDRHRHRSLRAARCHVLPRIALFHTASKSCSDVRSLVPLPHPAWRAAMRQDRPSDSRRCHQAGIPARRRDRESGSTAPRRAILVPSSALPDQPFAQACRAGRAEAPRQAGRRRDQ